MGGCPPPLSLKLNPISAEPFLAFYDSEGGGGGRDGSLPPLENNFTVELGQ